MKYKVVSPVRIEGRLYRVGETVECPESLLAGAQHCVEKIDAPKPAPKPRAKAKSKAAE